MITATGEHPIEDLFPLRRVERIGGFAGAGRAVHAPGRFQPAQAVEAGSSEHACGTKHDHAHMRRRHQKNRRSGNGTAHLPLNQLSLR